MSLNTEKTRSVTLTDRNAVFAFAIVQGTVRPRVPEIGLVE